MSRGVHKTFKINVLLCSTAVVWLSPAWALAHDAGVNADKTQAKADSVEIGEVIVTAQRRSERLMDVPIAITAANEETLLRVGVRNIENISTIAPSVNFQANKDASSSAIIQIRGIGTTGNAYSFEGAVGVFIDGVYRSRAGQALSSFLDVDSLQVLRGPQGTLFGKNTSAGAILLTSVRPSTDAIGGNVEAAYGNYDSYSVRGAVNLPLSDQAAFRFAGVANGRDGYFHDTTGKDLDSKNDYTLKAQFLVEPTNNLRVRLIGDYAHTGGDCCYATAERVSGPAQPLIDSLTRANGLTPPSPDKDDRQAVLNDFGRSTRVNDYGAALNIDLDTELGTLTSVTGLRRFTEDEMTDPDYSGADIIRIATHFKSSFISEELTFAGETKGAIKAKYVFGGFFSDEDLEVGRELYWGNQAQAFMNVLLRAAGPPGTANAAPGLLSVERIPATARSLAAFTHWTIALNDQLNMIAGIRYTRETKTGRLENPYFRDPVRDPFALLRVQPGRLYDARTVDNMVSGTLGLQYKPSRDAMLYLTYNRGAKAGGVILDVNAAGTPRTTANPTYRPENVDAFELGGKFRWMDGRANTNIALFYNRLTDLQVAQFLGLSFTVLNAPKAKSYGVEVDQTFNVNEFVNLSAGFQYLPEASFGVSTLLGPPLSGRRFVSAPKFSGNAAVDLSYPLNSSIDVTARLQVDYRSTYITGTATSFEQPGFALLNANLGLKSTSNGWLIEAFGRNLTNVTYATFEGNRPLQSGSILSYLGAPRTYGVRVRYQF